MDSINKLVFLFALVASAPMVFAQAGGDKKALLKKEDTCIGRIDNLKETENFIQTKDEKVFTTKSKEVDEVIKFCKSKLLLKNQNIFDYTQRICDISYNKVAEGSEDQVYLAVCKLDAASFVKSLKGEVES